jgi:hypothetical protein
VTDVEEGPPVPPFEEGGDRRIGWLVGGSFFAILGIGVLVAANLVLHHLAPAGGSRWGPIWIGSTMGWYAWSAVGFGILVGALGFLLVYLGFREPRGNFELPGAPFPAQPR